MRASSACLMALAAAGTRVRKRFEVRLASRTGAPAGTAAYCACSLACAAACRGYVVGRPTTANIAPAGFVLPLDACGVEYRR